MSFLFRHGSVWPRLGVGSARRPRGPKTRGETGPPRAPAGGLRGADFPSPRLCQTVSNCFPIDMRNRNYRAQITIFGRVFFGNFNKKQMSDIETVSLQVSSTPRRQVLTFRSRTTSDRLLLTPFLSQSNTMGPAQPPEAAAAATAPHSHLTDDMVPDLQEGWRGDFTDSPAFPV